MDTKNLKAYAPQARRDFIAAVKKRAAQFGLYEDRIADVIIEGSSAIIEGRVFTRKQAQQRSQLAKRISELGFNQFINEAAFTWVNRLTAIRYMEVNGYLEHGFRILSMPAKNDVNGNEVTAKFGEGFEILTHAADVAEHLELDKSHIVEMLLAGDKEEELYREILLGECHQLSKVMPFMFEKLDDATELLLPDNLTKTDSILKELVDRIPETDWQDIEVIGWLYQFYISEHKDTVIGKVVKKEDIPAATQLFTPNWIVKYLVQNSLGRQWLATYPESELKDKMEYYIAPAEQSGDVIEQLKSITPSSIDPETIKVLDPACGSGHILVEVYEVLREIYLERGYRLREIPELILTKNIYGLDIDDRAAQMAAFAMLMKAREDDRRIFDRISSNDIKLNIHSLQSTEYLEINQLWADLDLEGKHQTGAMSGLFDQAQQSVEPSGEYKVYLDLLRYLKSQFIEAKNLGSLIDIKNEHFEFLATLHEKLINKVSAKDTVATPAAEKLLPIVEQAIILARQYDIVVANPPYMGSKYQIPLVKKYLKDNFKGFEKDLFSAFIIRNLQLTKEHGELGFMTPFVWMFISSYEQLREKLINDGVISTLIQLEYSGFDGATVPICTFTITKGHIDNYKASYIKLSDFKGAANQAPKTLEAINDRSCDWIFDIKPDDFNQIPGRPISFWLSNNEFSLFENEKLDDSSNVCIGMKTGDNDKFVRHWFEVPYTDLGLNLKSLNEANDSSYTWFPYLKGGEYRKWHGNYSLVLNWKNEGSNIKEHINKGGLSDARLRPSNYDFYFQQGINWSFITSGHFGVRIHDNGFFFDVAGSSLFPKKGISDFIVAGFLNSTVAKRLLSAINPTLNMQIENIKTLPSFQLEYEKEAEELISQIKKLYKKDWDSFETSWGFCKSPILNVNANTNKLSILINQLIVNNNKVIDTARELETKNNEIFINEANLEGILDPSINDDEISLKINPYYTYGIDKSPLEIECSVQSKVLSNLISYSVGCMMGRYSLNREGLVYAHANNDGFNELVADGAYNTFPADDDGIIPLASEAWLFDDDATARFREFVKTVWGDEHLQENLDFVAESLCLDAIKPKNGESSLDTIRRYLSTQFYKDHLKTYKKRPIYWLFSSGKEKAFECLVYLHRYNEGTLSRMRTEYVTPLMGKFESQTSILRDERDTASSSEQRRIDKELKSIEKKQVELRTFDEELKHISELKISLDLDDGVKVNYGKFGNLLANVKDVHGKKPEVVK